MSSPVQHIRAAFDLLLTRGFTVAVESDAGMVGAVAYRSPMLWISLEWERGDPWLSFTLTGHLPNSFYWTEIDEALTGRSHPEYPPYLRPGAPIAQLATFVREHLSMLEARLTSEEERGVLLGRLQTLQEASRRDQEAHLRSRRFH